MQRRLREPTLTRLVIAPIIDGGLGALFRNAPSVVIRDRREADAVQQPAGRVLLVDDDPDTRALIEDILAGDGYEVCTCNDGQEALQVLEQARFDVILSDIKMPSLSGTDLLLHVRRMNLDTEVILMTAYASVQSAVKALRGEAFDYLTKPFSLKELRQVVRQAARSHSLHRRQHAVMSYQDLSIDLRARRVWSAGREVRLTRLEFDVLAYLFEHRGAAVTQQELLRDVWGKYGLSGRSNDTVKSCISRLRKKIEEDARRPTRILNIWGVGYQLGT